MSGAPGRTVADLELERYRLGELPEAEAQALRRALDSDPDLRARLAALEQSDAEIIAYHSPAVVAAAIRARAGGATPEPTMRPRWPPALAFAVGLAGAIFVSSAVLAPVRHGPVTGDTTRTKGLTPRLVVYRQRADASAEVLAPGAAARAGDVVQLAYLAAGRRFGAILSVDGRGVVTRHLPTASSRAVELEAGPTRLAQAYRLDDAPSFERFYFLASDASFSVDDVAAAARSQAGGEGAARLHLASTIDQYVFVLRKESP